MSAPDPLVTVGEIVECLSGFGGLRATIDAEIIEGAVAVHVVVPVEGQDNTDAAMAALEFGNAARQLADLGTLRALCERYGIPPAQLERFIAKGDD
jgi:hypothetical protein